MDEYRARVHLSILCYRTNHDTFHNLDKLDHRNEETLNKATKIHYRADQSNTQSTRIGFVLQLVTAPPYLVWFLLRFTWTSTYFLPKGYRAIS